MLDLLPKRRAIVAPARVWRNKWRALVDHPEPCPVCGETSVKDEVYLNHCEPFVSKDVAETVAAEQLADDISTYGYHQDEYLGAFEVDE